ncbi:glutamate-cysteine ligase catalytic subunit [Flagelloscypha sp. PMI_526]|nr:glutamate-cysteine ligase catalytic subunit [Flagelloscypha sp. PMI_526]
MGLLSLGTPLHWDEAKKYADHVRTHGIAQFLHIWDRLKDRTGDELLWGDEDDQHKTAALSLCQTEILSKLSSICDQLAGDCGKKFAVPTFHPEYGRYMLESTPGSPYTGSISDLLSVEANMRYRRFLAREHLGPNQIPLSFTSYPRMGTPGKFTEPYYDPVDAVSSHSLFLPQEITNTHVRFPTLTANIRRRRGSKVAINLPIFVDEKTPQPFIDPTIPWDRCKYKEDPEAKNGAALPNHIYMDAMGFGMGCCCLQLTFQACNVNDARRIYDSLVPVGPILLALSAASPAWRGYLADPLQNNRFKIPKSRYDSVDSYLSNDWRNREDYNDVESPYDESIYQRLRDHGLDHLLARHIAHLFIRDPIVIFKELLDLDDSVSSDHFENIQSTNWQTMRFKPPPPNSYYRMTDFENAAFAVFVVLLSRAILSFGLNFYIPISKVDENMQRGQRRDAAHSQRFFFRKDVFPLGQSRPLSSCSCSTASTTSSGKKETIMLNCFDPPTPPETGIKHLPVVEEFEEMNMNQIMNEGTGAGFPGLIPLVVAYLDTLDVEPESRKKIDKYIDLIRRRANGELKTAATWIREFVRGHPDYKQDSVVSERINYDLMKAVDEIERGVRREDGFLPADYTGGEVDKGGIGLGS